VIDDLDDGRERDLHNFAITALDLHAGRSEGLGSFHAAHDAADAMTVAGYNLDVAFAVQRLQRRQSLGDFHSVTFAKDLEGCS